MIPEMNVLFYGKMTHGSGERLKKVIEALVPENVKICRTIDSLCHGLRQPGHNMTIAVLLASSREDLVDILSIRDLLYDVRIILILPDRKDDTIAKGHTLSPRFLSYIGSDFIDVAAVLDKMLGGV